MMAVSGSIIADEVEGVMRVGDDSTITLLANLRAVEELSAAVNVGSACRPLASLTAG